MITIILPTFNRAPVLTRALESVLQQDFQDWELLISDDGSTDHTRTVAEEFIQRTGRGRYLYSPHNTGVSAARNRAVREARGEWLAFIDSDDEWLPNRLSAQMQLAGQYPLIHSEEIWIRNGVRVNAPKIYAKSGGRLFRRCVEICCISPSATLMRTDLYRSLGGFREDFPACEDYELWLRIAARHEIGFVDQALIKKYGGHADQLSTRYKAQDYFRVKALMPFLDSEEISDDDRAHVAEAVRQRCAILLKGYQKHGNMENYAEVEGWLRRVSTPNHSAHSTADRLPLSESSLSL